ncbi:MAG: response regulator [Gammaproteobacteria bacterium]|nr:response regulator [Gammaproteobacteria bacterium]
MGISTKSQKGNVGSTKQKNFLLFIDDNPLILETVKQLVEKSSYDLLLKDDPFDGLCALAKNKPSAVFIDVNIGKLDGYQFCALVKAQSIFQYIPLIVVLEFASKLEQAKAYAAGANAVLVKPFGKNELLKLCFSPGAQAA